MRSLRLFGFTLCFFVFFSFSSFASELDDFPDYTYSGDHIETDIPYFIPADEIDNYLDLLDPENSESDLFYDEYSEPFVDSSLLQTDDDYSTSHFSHLMEPDYQLSVLRAALKSDLPEVDPDPELISLYAAAPDPGSDIVLPQLDLLLLPYGVPSSGQAEICSSTSGLTGSHTQGDLIDGSFVSTLMSLISTLISSGPLIWFCGIGLTLFVILIFRRLRSF